MDDPRSSVFCGVERSVCGRRWRLRSGDSAEGQIIAERLGLPEIIGRLLAQRGVDVDHAPLFLAPRLRDQLPDPSHLLRHGCRRGAPRPRGAGPGNHRDFWRLRCRRRDIGGAADAVFRRGRRRAAGSMCRIACARVTGRTSRRCCASARGGRERRRHRRLRHHRPSSRSPRRRDAGST